MIDLFHRLDDDNSFSLTRSEFKQGILVSVNLDNYRSEINLRNNRKVKFKIPKTSLTKVNKSPFYRGVRL